MIKSNKILNLRQQILAIAGSMVILRLGFVFLFLQADMLRFRSFVGLIILFVAAVGLMRGQTWAKYYYTFAAGVSIFNLLMAIPSIFVSKALLPYKIVFLILFAGAAIWSVYVIIFLNTTDVFDQYKKMLESGANFDNAGKVELDELIEEMLPMDYNDFNNISDYKLLLEDIFDWLEVTDKVEKMYIDENNKSTIIIEATDTLHKIDVYVNKQIFDNRFLGKVNTILREWVGKDKYLGVIYPETVLHADERSFVYENGLTFRQLRTAGFYKN